jgi:hypothetical protein
MDSELLTETELRVAFREWTSGLPGTEGRSTAVRRRVRRRRQLVATGSAVAAAAAVVLVVALGPWGAHATKLDVPPIKKPAPVVSLPSFARAVQGGVVVGQVAGAAGESRTLSVRWPAKGRAQVLYRCGRPDVGPVRDDAWIRMEVAGSDGVETLCVPGQVTPFDLTLSKLGTIPAGQDVDLVVTTSESDGPWAVAVLDTDPHWVDGYVAGPRTLGPRRLVSSFRGGSAGTSSESFRIDKTDDDAVLVLECSEAGRLAVLLGGNEVGAVTCPDSAYSAQVVQIPLAELASDGWVVGHDVKLALKGSGGAQSFAGLLVYGR